MEKWVSICRPSYLGKHRNDKIQEWSANYNNWRLVWKIGDIDVDFLGVCALYEDAYFEFLRGHPDILNLLLREAVDVYDDEESNVNSGFDYTKQETVRTHIQDIAIRRALLRMGLWFKGQKLIRIRQEKGDHPLSMILSPGRVPFHKPELIAEPELVGWWDVKSVESFYQSNKFLQVRESWVSSKIFPGAQYPLIHQLYGPAVKLLASFSQKQLIDAIKNENGEESENFTFLTIDFHGLPYFLALRGFHVYQPFLTKKSPGSQAVYFARSADKKEGLLLQYLSPHANTSRHYHQFKKESYHLIEGEAFIQAGGETYCLHGTYWKQKNLTIEPGVIHQVRTKNQPALILLEIVGDPEGLSMNDHHYVAE